METRRLGSSDLELSTVGIGTWAIGGANWLFGWGAQDDAAAVAAIVRAVDRGANWIDTAAVYGQGHAETLVGRALRGLPSSCRPYVATKCGRKVNPDGSVRGELDCGSILAECDASLSRLGTDVIDLYQMHWPDPDPAIEEGWATLVELQQRGKVRHIGVSNFDVGQMRRVQAIHPVASLQPPYSMLARDVEAEILGFCAANGIGVVAYSPMGKGLLTGSFTPARAAALPADDHRSRDPQFQAPRLGVNLDLVAGLTEIARQGGKTVAQLAIAWVLRRPEVTSAIAGLRRPDQVDEVVAAGSCRLEQGEIAAIEDLLAQRGC